MLVRWSLNSTETQGPTSLSSQINLCYYLPTQKPSPTSQNASPSRCSLCSSLTSPHPSLCVLELPFSPSLFFFLYLFSCASLFPSFLFPLLPKFYFIFQGWGQVFPNYPQATYLYIKYIHLVLPTKLQAPWRHRLCILPLLSSMAPSSVPSAQKILKTFLFN